MSGGAKRKTSTSRKAGDNVEKNLCNHIDKDGRCKEKATRVIVFEISDSFRIRTKLCKKHYGEVKRHDKTEENF